MKWLQNLINWFKGVPVKSAGRLVKNAKPNSAFAAAMQQTRLVLETPNGKKWLKSLSIDEFNALKKQIADNKITASQLNGKILSYNFPEVSKLFTYCSNFVCIFLKKFINSGLFSLEKRLM